MLLPIIKSGGEKVKAGPDGAAIPQKSAKKLQKSGADGRFFQEEGLDSAASL